MITIGIDDYDPVPERELALEMGTILAVVPGDRVERIWAGGRDGADFLMVRARGADGVHLMSRVRVHRDDKTLNSDDEKHGAHVVAAPEIFDIDPDRIESPQLMSANLFGIGVVHRFEVDVDGEDFIPVLMGILRDLGWDVALGCGGPVMEG